jgi:hypothetical protein
MLLCGNSSVLAWLALASRAAKHKLLRITDDGQANLVGALFLGGSLGYEVSLAKLVLAVSIGLDVEFKEQRFAAILAVELLDAALRDADGNVFFAVLACDFLRSLQLEEIKRGVDGVIRHVSLSLVFVLLFQPAFALP